MHPSLQKLAEKVGVRIEDRAIDNSHIFDGSSIGTHSFRCIWSDDLPGWTPKDPTELVRKEPLEMISLSDHAILHEIAHFAAAEECQRDLPEFGLGYVGEFAQLFVPSVVEPEEQSKQEAVTHFLCCFWGSRENISPRLSNCPERYCESWEVYFGFKESELKDFSLDSLEIFSRAIAIIQKVG